MATLNGEAHHITMANLPQNVDGGIRIRGFNDPRYDTPEDTVLLFTHLEGNEAVCKVEGTKNTISIEANAPIVELGGDEYQFEYPSNADVAAA